MTTFSAAYDSYALGTSPDDAIANARRDARELDPTLTRTTAKFTTLAAYIDTLSTALCLQTVQHHGKTKRICSEDMIGTLYVRIDNGTRWLFVSPYFEGRCGIDIAASAEDGTLQAFGTLQYPLTFDLVTDVGTYITLVQKALVVFAA